MNAHKQFVNLVGSYGLRVEHTKGHYAVTKDGKRVGTVSHSGEVNAYRQAIRDLARQKLVGDEARRVKFS
jgi:hypothetical protein